MVPPHFKRRYGTSTLGFRRSPTVPSSGHQARFTHPLTRLNDVRSAHRNKETDRESTSSERSGTEARRQRNRQTDTQTDRQTQTFCRTECEGHSGKCEVYGVPLLLPRVR